MTVQKDQVMSAARHFFSGTVLSRFSGMFRDIAMAFYFGTAPAMAVFMVAFRFSNIMRRLLGETPLSSSFIPHFESLRTQSSAKSAKFYVEFFFTLSLMLIVIIVVIELVLYSVSTWKLLSTSNLDIIYLTMIMFPGLLFITLFGLNSSLLQCEQYYFLTGVAPCFFNIIWIAGVFAMRHYVLEEVIYGLSAVIVIAFCGQWLMTVPKTIRFVRAYLTWQEIRSCKLFGDNFRKILGPFFLGMIGIGASQINSGLDAIFARSASLEGPSYLWYAIRLQQLPLAFFGIALSSALLPPLARAMKGGDFNLYLSLLRSSFSKAISVMLPSTFALFVLGISSINLLFGRGSFNDHSVMNTTTCLWGYTIGLIPAAFVLLIAPAFYVRKDFRTPALASFYSVALNLALNSYLVFGLKLGPISIAIATSMSSFFNAGYLLYQLNKQIGSIIIRDLALLIYKVGFCCGVSSVLTLFLGEYFLGDSTIAFLLGQPNIQLPHHLLTQLVQFGLQAIGFLGMFLLMSRLLGVQEVFDILKISVYEQETHKREGC